MKRLALLFWLITSSGWTWCALASHGFEHLMRPIYGEPTLQSLKVRAGLNALSALTGFIESTNVTAFTAVLWMKVASYPAGCTDGGIIINSSFTVSPARSTKEGGPGLADLLNNDYLVTPIPLSADGTWHATCLPNSYDCPENLASKWQYGCYCLNLTTDTPLTLTVGGAELYVPATNCMIRNIQAVTADRTITIAAERADACINIGIAVNPLIQFIDAGTSSNFSGLSNNFDISHGGPTSTEWRMIVMRGKIEGTNAIGRTDSYNATTHFDNHETVTTELAHPRATFAHDSRIRFFCSNFFGGLHNKTTGEDVQILFYGDKLIEGWLSDGEIEHLRDIDAYELRRRGVMP